MAVNQATLALVREHEGLRLEAYPDPAHGWSVPTIGYGHTSAAGEPRVRKGLVITEREAVEILARDLADVERQVRELVKVPLNENQLGALVSFTFNLGAGNLERSTLLKKLNAGDYHGASNEFQRWKYAGGKVLPGLVRRRRAERDLFRTPAAKQPPQPAPAPSRPTKSTKSPSQARGWAAALIAAIGAALFAFAKSQGWIP